MSIWSMLEKQRRAYLARWTGSPLGEGVVVFFVFLVLSLLATYPLPLYFDRAPIGAGDSVQNVWNLWWVQRNVFHGDLFPFTTPFLYYPTGVSLAYHPLGVVNGWLGALLQWLFDLNLVASFNSIALFSCVGSGMGTYLLVRQLTHNRMAAFVAGIVFTFAPIRMSRIYFGNLEMYSTQYIPFLVLFFIELLRRPRYRVVWAAALFFALTAWSSLYLAYGATLLLITVLAGAAFFARRQLQTWLRLLYKPLLVFGVTSVVLVMPVVLPLVVNYADFQDQADQRSSAVANSADLLGFFVPDRMTDPLPTRLFSELNRFVDATYGTFYGNAAEKSVFIGYTVIAVMVLSALFVRRREFWGWAAIALLFAGLSLGPVLYVFGRPVLHHLPYEWLNSLPLISFGRAPSRYAIFVMFALAVAGGYGLAALTQRRRIGPWLTLVVGVVIYVEFLIVPIRVDMRFTQIPSFYAQLATTEDHSDAVILDVPIDLVGASGPAGEYMLFQTVHQKPIVSGYVSRTPDSIYKRLEAPFFYTLRARIYGSTAPFVLDDAFLTQLPDELDRLDVAFLVLHRWALAPADFDTLYSAFFATFTVPVYEDDQITVWRLN